MTPTYNKALADYKASHGFFIQECFEEWLYKMMEIGCYTTCNIINNLGEYYTI